MADFTISTALKMTDGVSPVFSVMEQSSKKYFNKQNTFMRRANSDWSRIASTAKGFFAGQVITQGFNRITGSLQGLTNQWLLFDDASHFAASKFQEVQEDVTLFDAALARTKRTAMEVGAQTKYTAGEVASAMEILASQGESLEDTNTNTMLAIARLANVARVDLPEATAILTGSLSAWGLGFEHINTMSDTLVKSFTTSKQSILDVGEATKISGALFRGASQDIFTYNTLLAGMARTNVKSEEAGTKLRSILVGFSTPKAIKGFRHEGIDLADAEGDFRNLITVFSEIKKKTDEMGSKKSQDWLSNILGFKTRDSSIVKQLIDLSGGGEDSLQEYYKKAKDIEKATEKQNALVKGSIAQRLKILESAFTSKFFTSLETGRSSFADAITNIVHAIDNFDMTKINQFIDTNLPRFIDLAGEAGNAALPAIKDIGSFLSYWVEPLTKILKLGAPLIDWMLRIRFALLVGAGARTLLTASIWGNIAAKSKDLLISIAVTKQYWALLVPLKLYKIGMNLATIAQTALNGAITFMLSPIGLAIAAVAVLAVGIWVLYKKWDEWGEVITSTWEKARPFLTVIGAVLVGVGIAIGSVGAIATAAIAAVIDLVIIMRNNWDNVKKSFEAGGISSALKTIGGTFVFWLLRPVDLMIMGLHKIGVLSKETVNSWKNMHNEFLTLGVPKEETGDIVQSIIQKPVAPPRSIFDTAPSDIIDGKNGKDGQNNIILPSRDFSGFDFSRTEPPNVSEVAFKRQSVDVTTRLENRTDMLATTEINGDTGAIANLGR